MICIWLYQRGYELVLIISNCVRVLARCRFILRRRSWEAFANLHRGRPAQIAKDWFQLWALNILSPRRTGAELSPSWGRLSDEEYADWPRISILNTRPAGLRRIGVVWFSILGEQHTCAGLRGVSGVCGGGVGGGRLSGQITNLCTRGDARITGQPDWQDIQAGEAIKIHKKTRPSTTRCQDVQEIQILCQQWCTEKWQGALLCQDQSYCWL